jgi:hypothetical protein
MKNTAQCLRAAGSTRELLKQEPIWPTPPLHQTFSKGPICPELTIPCTCSIIWK